MNKVWHKTIISTEEQEVTIYPTEDWTGIIVETQELDSTASTRMYLTNAEMDLLILKMKEMMAYVKSKQHE